MGPGRDTVLAAGGSLPPDGVRTWAVRPDLSFYAVASPLGADPIVARAALDGTVEALGQAIAYRATLEKPACVRLRGAILASGQSWERSLGAHAEYRGLAATLAAILIAPGYAAVAHLGDCRVIQIRDAGATRRTVDHVTRLKDGRRAVVRFIGNQSNPEVEAWPTLPGDVFVLTAVVHEVVPEEDLVHCLSRPVEASETIRNLIELAGRHRPRTAVTAVAMQVGDAVAG